MTEDPRRVTPCEHGPDVGAYLLGALAEDESAWFAAHLAECERCRGEVAELRTAVDALPLAAAQVVPPAELKERIMGVVRSEAELLRAPDRGRRGAEPDTARRRARWWRAPVRSLRPVPAALAACLLLAAGVAGGLLLSGGEPGVRSVPAQVRIASAPGATATLMVGPDTAQLKVSGMPAPPGGKVYQVWLKRPRKAPDPTDALFTVRSNGSATVDVPGGVKGVDQVLVTAEPDGGSRAPTSAPVIIASPA
jgi:anti-sigma factor RsiW